MKTHFIKSQFLFLAFVCILVSCKKNVAGPVGEQGVAGKGIDSTQYFSISLVQTQTAWNANGKMWESELLIPQITAEVIQKGEVIVYLQNDSAWQCLPHQVGDVFTLYSIEPGKVNLRILATHGSNEVDKPALKVFRVVIFL